NSDKQETLASNSEYQSRIVVGELVMEKLILFALFIIVPDHGFAPCISSILSNTAIAARCLSWH
ncbi:MAG: hypothetical protein WBD01_07920, partial [Salaquimonas sp.]